MNKVKSFFSRYSHSEIRRRIAVMLVALACASLASCGKSSDSTASSDAGSKSSSSPPPATPVQASAINPPKDQSAEMPKPAPKIKVNTIDGADMVYIPSGEFKMGDNDISDNPRHTVKLSGYWMYKNLVTVGQYNAFCKATGRQMPKEPPGSCPVFGQDSTGNPISYITTGGGANFNPNWSKEDHPIIDVTWDDALAYAQWAHADLPTEAQWEKAARGTDGRKYPWGDNFDTSKLWCSKKELFDSGGTHSVGELGISPFGCTDMAGNVSQWCKDWYDADFWEGTRATGTDPQNMTEDTAKPHVMRGGSWDYAQANWLRSASRNSARPSMSFNNCGFRCAVVGDSAGLP